LLPGQGDVVGAALTRDTRVRGVIFTGSTEVAQLINRTLAARSREEGVEIALIAETGGQNALIVDSSALPEQVVQDALSSAFDSAGQRCSALRVLFLQEEIADKTLRMLKGAMQELRVGRPDRLATDIGPVIDAEARDNLLGHIERTRRNAKSHFALDLPAELVARGTFVPPTVLEIGSLSELTKEVFGPVLHVIRYRRADLPTLIDNINASGFGLTLGVHSRIDETIDYIASRAHVGNIYINRNIVGAVVGVQPFGGEGKSGTGPKAGGPLYLKRLRVEQDDNSLPQGRAPQAAQAALASLSSWATAQSRIDLVNWVAHYQQHTPVGASVTLPGPTGERNTLSFAERGNVLCAADDDAVLLHQLAAVFATGNRAIVLGRPLPAGLPNAVLAAIEHASDLALVTSPFQIALLDAGRAGALGPILAARDGALISVIDTTAADAIPLWRLVAERALCVNTTAAGGNASLMTLGL
jgi:RHH-type proline utilization regulon transcriptional repressor/proline dehydrogenase/delta 1-pyrroline-5-carboxylate dehydrogenase